MLNVKRTLKTIMNSITGGGVINQSRLLVNHHSAIMDPATQRFLYFLSFSIYCPQSFSGGGLYSSKNGLLLLLLLL